jgi:hypothetical protein
MTENANKTALFGFPAGIEKTGKVLSFNHLFPV